jgi:hypothetical protein
LNGQWLPLIQYGRFTRSLSLLGVSFCLFLFLFLALQKLINKLIYPRPEKENFDMGLLLGKRSEKKKKNPNQ